MKPAAQRLAFWGVTLLIPLTLMTGAEFLFRAAGIFAPDPLCIEVPDSRGAVLKFNPWVTRRYFDSTSAALPNLLPEVFPRIKPSTTFRVLCLGESTTAGFPFEGSVPFPVQLREMLARAYPAKRVEVLNAGISAISSYVVLDMLPELLEMTHPDAVVIYMGHNEFYGIYGSGSTLFPGRKRTLVTLMLRLQHLHLVQGVKRALAALRPRPPTVPQRRTLMQSVVGEQDIALGSEEYRATLEAYAANLRAIADECRDRHVPVVIGNLISNWKDQPPFHSFDPHRTVDGTGGGIQAAIAAGDSALAAGIIGQAEAAYHQAFTADSGNADAWYGLARTALARADTAAAPHWFLGAKDLDAMRFRASEEFNAVITRIAAERQLVFVDVKRAFQAHSPGGIIGAELMCDHLHPTPQGYYLMAKAFFDAIVTSGHFPTADGRFVSPPGPYGVTDLDWEIGLVKVFPMLHEWPFKPRPISRGEYRSHGDTAATRVAIQYHRTGFAWTRAHDMMGHLYVQQGALERARQEYMAIAVYQPDDPWPHQQIARLYEAEGNWSLRSAALQAALIRSTEKGMIAYQLGLSKYKQGDLKNAIVAMEFASGAPDLKPEERWNARFHLAGFLSDAGKVDDAAKILRGILAENPNFDPARVFLSQLDRRHP